MIKYLEGTVFNTDADMIVNTVNCVGAMGRGIALEYKLRYPKLYEEYRKLCQVGKITIGNVYCHKIDGQKILSFPTKNHWRYPSKLEYVEAGLQDFSMRYKTFGIKSVAFPKLGTNNGGLRWDDVKILMEKYLGNLDIQVFICLDSLTEAQGVEHEMLKLLNKVLSNPIQTQRFSKELKLTEKIVDDLKYFRGNRIYQLSEIRSITSLRYEKIFKYLFQKVKSGDVSEFSTLKDEPKVEQLTLDLRY